MILSSRRSDLMNERLPQAIPNNHSLTPINMRRDSDGGLNMEVLIKRTLEDNGDEGGVVERLAERIARGRNVTGRPMPLKRFETT